MIRVGDVSVGGGLVLICGPCVIESREQILEHAEKISAAAGSAGVPLVLKSSYDKANRTSSSGFRGVGMRAGLECLAEVREKFGVPVVTDVHSPEEVLQAAQVVDLLQIPAFLCRQTDLLVAAGRSGKPVMIKKGQFLHPDDMAYAAEKVGSGNVLLCERGSCFGYRDLVVDMRGLAMMRSLGFPVIFDATHSVQSMGGAGGKSGGRREFIPPLARAAVAFGVDGVFLECHVDPDQAPSDGPNMIPLANLLPLVRDLKRLAELNLETRNGGR